MKKEMSKNTGFLQILEQTGQSSLLHTLLLNKDSTNSKDLHQNIKLRFSRAAIKQLRLEP